jgi:hypothetical protein
MVISRIFGKLTKIGGPLNREFRSSDNKLKCYSEITLRSQIEAPLISREVLPETYFLLVIMAADAQAGQFLQFQASCSCGIW